MHDFAITQKHVVLLDSSLVVAPQASALLCKSHASKSSLTLYVARHLECSAAHVRIQHITLCLPWLLPRFQHRTRHAGHDKRLQWMLHTLVCGHLDCQRCH